MMQQSDCQHPPTRLYSWFAHDGTLCVGCCDCGEVLTGGVDSMPDTDRDLAGDVEEIVDQAQY